VKIDSGFGVGYKESDYKFILQKHFGLKHGNKQSRGKSEVKY